MWRYDLTWQNVVKIPVARNFMTAKQVNNWINTKEETQEESISNPPKRPPINRINVDMEWHGMTWTWFALICDIWNCSRIPGGILHLRPGMKWWRMWILQSYHFWNNSTYQLVCFVSGADVFYMFPQVWIFEYVIFFLNLDSLNSRRKMRWLQWSGEMRTSRSNSVRHLQRVKWHPVKWRMSEWVKNGSNGSKTIEIYDNLNNLDASLINI